MFSRFRHVFGVLFFLLVASCSGGGCSSGCGGCGGTTPLPGGFPKDKTIENAASVRVSRPGLDFVEKNLPAVVTKVANAPGGVLGFDIPNIDPREDADRRPQRPRKALRRHERVRRRPRPGGHAAALPRRHRHRQVDVPDRRGEAERDPAEGAPSRSSSTTPRSRPMSPTTRRSSARSTSAASRSTSATATAAAATASRRSRRTRCRSASRSRSSRRRPRRAPAT